MWVVVVCWIDCVWSSIECACFACDPSVYLSVPYIGFVYVFVCRKLSPQVVIYVVYYCLFMIFVLDVIVTKGTWQS